LEGLIAILSHVILEFWHTAQPESLGAIVLSWAPVWSSYEAISKERSYALKKLSSWIAAGFLFGFAFLLKTTLGG
jgi:hypothetical protein